MESTFRTPDTSTVVVGVDGSDTARAAAMWAAGEAVRRDRPLHIVYGADTDGRALYLAAETIERVRANGRQLLDDTAKAVTDEYAGLRVSTEFSGADAAHSLHQAGALHGTIVVGNRGLGGFNSLLLGSVGLDVAAAAMTPVIVVRGIDGAEETGTVLAAVRDEHDLLHARYAAREAELRKGSLRLLHVWNVLESVGEVVGMLDGVDEIASAHADALRAVTDAVRDEFPDLEVRADAEKSISVAGVLVEASRHADLLVMGGRRVPSALGLARNLGRATHSVLHHAHCPVLLIPRTGSDFGNRP
ncbi:universal stress protein [Streptomyces spororaveus]|uniref:Universal stress protein n=1 Tax=Streptomyces spororaveus TaxID=284039 RepID=A0ABQ3TQG4_9ACTN|nr:MULTISPECIES: universal stress protein [Streptomyces]MCM9077417.1 universal stress protein [Streptomyces spororaveus]MCX5308110.1 universal stress protein [Streptomyces sp. NBC_00160]GHI82262.1 universal stress protein [Streptomyces spororaveus]